MITKKPCNYCLRPGHTAFVCPSKPRKQMGKSQLKPKKRMKKIGKVGRLLIEQAKRFRAENPGAQKCYYCLFIGVDQLIDDYNVEHPYSKVRHPELRFAYDLLIVSCPWHNEDKGSMDIDEYLEKLKKERDLWQEQHRAANKQPRPTNTSMTNNT